MQTFQTATLTLNYSVYGHGPLPLLAFPGFGQPSTSFDLLKTSLGNTFTIYCFDLSFPDSNELTSHAIEVEEFETFIRDFLNSIHAEKFSLLGFSLGGRIALKVIERFRGSIQGVFLLAPDGIKISFWYRFLTGNNVGRKLFRRMVHYPDRYLFIIRLLQRLKILGKGITSFVTSALDTEDKRILLYNTWMKFRKLIPDRSLIDSILKDKKISLHLIYGSTDAIMPPSVGEKFSIKLDRPGSLHVIECGHQLVRPELNELLSGILSKESFTTN